VKVIWYILAQLQPLASITHQSQHGKEIIQTQLCKLEPYETAEEDEGMTQDNKSHQHSGELSTSVLHDLQPGWK
jgi:hypothetical protein